MNFFALNGRGKASEPLIPANKDRTPTSGKAAHLKPLIQLQQVVKVYETAGGGFTALRNIDLEIYPGEFVGVIGKSGAGKTTLLNMISGVDGISSGEVLVGGTNGKPAISIHRLDENQQALWRGMNLGIIHQSFQLLPMLNLVENVLLPVDFSGKYQNGKSRQRALELLRLVELEEHAFKLPAAISGGQKQRAAIARALINDPPILIAYEPTGSLDTLTAETIFEIFVHLVEKGKTILMVTHDNNLGARFSRRIYLSDGQIVDDSGYQTGKRV